MICHSGAIVIPLFINTLNHSIMKRFIAIFAACAACVMISCNKEESIVRETSALSEETNSVITKAVGDKTPHTLVYVETNDVNPLNAGDWYLDDGTTYFDYVCLFSSNIHKTTVSGATQPTLYLNDKLTPILEGGLATYVEPLQDLGIGVLLGVLGDWQGIGLSNMTTTQADQFATILAYAINKYNLDGVVFDDEYSGTNSIVSGSYSRIITKLRELMPNIIIIVFDWGRTSYISSTAAAEIDYANHGYFGGYFRSYSTSNITGMTAARWSPISLELGGSTYSYSSSNLQTWGYNAVHNNYGEVMFFNLRPISDYNPTTILQNIANGTGWGTVSCTNGDRTRDAGSVTNGYTITYAMATAD